MHFGNIKKLISKTCFENGLKLNWNWKIKVKTKSKQKIMKNPKLL